MEKLEEPEVIVLCRKEDEAVAADAVNDAVAKYKSVHSDKQCPKVILDSKRFLPPSSRTATHPPTWYVSIYNIRCRVDRHHVPVPAVLYYQL